MIAINRVVIVGRLTRDPELRRTTTDTPVTSFTLAVDDRNRSIDNNKTTSFIPVTVWNKQAETICKYLHKGSLVGIDGRLLQRNYERKDGAKVSILEVVAELVQFLDSKSKDLNREEGIDDFATKTNEDKHEEETAEIKEKVDIEEKNDNGVDLSDDDLPF